MLCARPVCRALFLHWQVQHRAATDLPSGGGGSDDPCHRETLQAPTYAALFPDHVVAKTRHTTSHLPRPSEVRLFPCNCGSSNQVPTLSDNRGCPFHPGLGCGKHGDPSKTTAQKNKGRNHNHDKLCALREFPPWFDISLPACLITLCFSYFYFLRLVGKGGGGRGEGVRLVWQANPSSSFTRTYTAPSTGSTTSRPSSASGARPAPGRASRSTRGC